MFLAQIKFGLATLVDLKPDLECATWNNLS